MSRSLLPVLALILLFPAPAEARKKAKKDEAPRSAYGTQLDNLTLPVPGSSRRSSSADHDGDTNIGPGESAVLANIEGGGVIDRIWIAIEGSEFWRDMVIEITWDGASAPSVQAPVGDFFAVGPGARQTLQSVPLAVQSGGRSLTSLWKMPFRESARVVLINEGTKSTRQLQWEIDYRTLPSLPEESMYFHAQYTQENAPEAGRPVTVLRAAGSGQYVGMSVSAQNGEPGAWGTGAVHFEVDGDSSRGPGGISVLNYFGNIFGLARVDGAYQGCTLDEGDRVKARSSVYRFHIHDPVPFESSLSIQLDHGQENERVDRLAAVAYWYQAETQVPFEKLPTARERHWEAPSDDELELWKRADTLHSDVIIAYRRNDIDQALVLLEELLELEPDSVYASYNLACLYALSGESDKSLHMLEQAIDLGFTELSFARHDPDLTSLHGHARFEKLVGEPADEAEEGKNE